MKCAPGSCCLEQSCPVAPHKPTFHRKLTVCQSQQISTTRGLSCTCDGKPARLCSVLVNAGDRVSVDLFLLELVHKATQEPQNCGAWLCCPTWSCGARATRLSFTWLLPAEMCVGLKNYKFELYPRINLHLYWNQNAAMLLLRPDDTVAYYALV